MESKVVKNACLDFCQITVISNNAKTVKTILRLLFPSLQFFFLRLPNGARWYKLLVLTAILGLRRLACNRIGHPNIRMEQSGGTSADPNPSPNSNHNG